MVDLMIESAAYELIKQEGFRKAYSKDSYEVPGSPFRITSKCTLPLGEWS